MKAPRDLGPDFREWMGDVPPMPDDLPQRTLEETKRTRQRRRWPWPWFLPAPKPTAGADGRQDPPGPPAQIARTGGLPPAPIGGTRTMLSGTKMAGLVALVALVGSMLAVTAPLHTDKTPLGAAEGEGPTAITPVHGTFLVHGRGSTGTLERHDWGMATMDSQWRIEYDVDDPRLRGEAYGRMNEYDIKGLPQGPITTTSYIENEGGSWTGTAQGYQDPESRGQHLRGLLIGHGGYDGLTAILSIDAEYFGAPYEVSGVIVEGPLPPMPEPVSEIPE